MENHILIFEPSGLRVKIDRNTTILAAARKTGLYIPSECGGRGTCGKCRVKLYPAPQPSDLDRQHITPTEIEGGIRLACEHRVKSDTRVLTLHAHAKSKILTKSEPETQDWIIDKEIAGQAGIAVDIGTTTIVVYLLDLGTGLLIGSASALNPQISYGEDVISRITFATQNENGLKVLQDCVVKKIEELVIDLCLKNNVTLDHVTKMSIVGNTVMHHFFLGLDTTSLGVAPYEPVMKKGFLTDTSNIGFESLSGEIYCAPNIAGFVGSDIVALILSQRLDLLDEVVLAIDIGTNGEIVLSNHGEILCCSTAAGSAFEGATISQGMRAQDGAIEYVSIKDLDEPPEISTIGHVLPQGFCGSGIVDVVSELRRTGLIDESGKMSESIRTIRNELDILGYLVVDIGEHGSERQIAFTQKDVRQVQLAKGAISAGIQILMNSADVNVSDIDRVLLAGAFGTYINPKSARTINLLPPVDIDKVFQVGNTAGSGARLLLLSSDQRHIVEELAKSVKCIELSTHPDFSSLFVNSTGFEDS